MRRWILLGLVALSPIAARSLAAQSLLSTRGLGVPTPAMDARGRVLGGIGTGLFGFTGSFVNPADVAGVPLRGISAAIQPMSRHITFGGDEDDAFSNRFPLIQVTYPVSPRLVPFAGVGSFLDQSYSISTRSTELVGDDLVQVQDLVQSTGGVVQIQIGASYLLTPGFAVGAAVGRYSGRTERILTRTFPELPPEELAPFEDVRAWVYSGPMASVGFRWDASDFLLLAGSATWSGTITAEGDEGKASDYEVKVPLQFAFGASAVLAPQLTATAGVHWAGWSSTADDLPGGASDTWHVGGGLEWLGTSMFGRPVPLRVGGSIRRLPFPFQGESPREWTVGVGGGIRFAGGQAFPLAQVDAGLERGSISAGGALEEQFWRFTMGVNLFAF